MFTGFNLKTNRDFKSTFEDQSAYNNMRKKVEGELDKYIGVNGKIDGTKLQNDWFPTINADIFISHSHADENLAIGLSGWLKRTFGLNSFIDSCVWGYSNNLLRIIDDKYCKNSGSNVYDYNERNKTTSHVHMMLSSALNKMIDKTECIIFLNTQNSVQSTAVNSTENIIKNQTESPWIYSEITATNLIRRKNLSEYRNRTINKKFEKFANENVDFDIVYRIDLSSLTDINDSHLNRWEMFKTNEGNKLDYLYKIVKPNILHESEQIHKGIYKNGRY